MKGRSPLHAFVAITRNFGLMIALRVTYSKIRGWLCPWLALTRPPLRAVGPRELSVVLSTVGQSATTLNAMVDIVAEQSASNWEICICECLPTSPEMASALERWRGTQAWLRIITSDESVNEATAARRTVEQTTGQYVALVAWDYTPNATTFEKLLDHLRDNAEICAAFLVGTDNAHGHPPLPTAATECRLLIQRKAIYLATFSQRMELSVTSAASTLSAAGVTSVYIADNGQ